MIWVILCPFIAIGVFVIGAFLLNAFTAIHWIAITSKDKHHWNGYKPGQ